MKWMVLLCIALIIGSFPTEWFFRKTYRHVVKVKVLYIMIEMSKGIVVVLLAWWWLGFWAALWSTVAVVFGAMLSGGAGLFVAIGACIVLSPILMLVGLAVFLLSLILTKYPSTAIFLSTLAVMMLSLVLTAHLAVGLLIICLGSLFLYQEKQSIKDGLKRMKLPFRW